MFPLWDLVVAPVLEAAGVRQLVEIGALRGENTRQILDRLGPDSVLHVIDPLPDFDPAAHEREFAGQYVFHRDLSLNVLGDLPPMDAALVDGDHNWYTVHNELRLLADVARRAGRRLPLLVLHDVSWPYGRRDLYYEPTNIPDEHRQPWSRAGMRPGVPTLLEGGGGLNPTLANAQVEGGPRNGVMTGLDDFIAGYDRAIRKVVVPIYFGLAIAVEQAQVEEQPALAEVLDHLESPMGKDELLELGEAIRLDGMIFQHNIYFHKEQVIQRLADRYLDSTEVAIEAAAHGSRARLQPLRRALDSMREQLVRGDLAVVGGGPEAAFVAAYLDAHDITDRRLWVATDDAEAVTAELERLGLPSDRVRAGRKVLDEGRGPKRVALLHITTGADAERAAAVRRSVRPRLAPDAPVLDGDVGPRSIARGAAEESPEPTRYFICHMQKTAGTTLRNRLRASFTEDEIYPNGSDGPDGRVAMISVSTLEERWKARGTEIRLLTGHFPLRTIERFGVPFTTLTVLRNPVERTLSFLRHQAARRQRGASEDTPLVDIYEDPFRFEKMVQNHMVRMLSLAPEEMGPGDGVLSTVPYTPARLELAKEALAGLDLFGLQDRFEELCGELSTRFGLEMGPPTRDNTTEGREVPPGLADRIAEDNALDMELYDYAVKLYEARHA